LFAQRNPNEMSEGMISPVTNPVPAILIPVPPATASRSAEAVQLQRACARRALRLSAESCGAPIDGWKQSPNGAPLPHGSWHWSISHTRGWAAAVVADQPVGIDVEQIRPRRDELFNEIASEQEWVLAGGPSWPAFFRIWTAKEAVLKANGVGIGRLDDCRISGFDTEGRIVLSFDGAAWRVEHHEFEGHVACVTCGVRPIGWRIVDPIHQQDAITGSVRV
jgi:4'-phosphopantetheinyl transferase